MSTKYNMARFAIREMELPPESEHLREKWLRELRNARITMLKERLAELKAKAQVQECEQDMFQIPPGLHEKYLSEMEEKGDEICGRTPIPCINLGMGYGEKRTTFHPILKCPLR